MSLSMQSKQPTAPSLVLGDVYGRNQSKELSFRRSPTASLRASAPSELTFQWLNASSMFNGKTLGYKGKQ